MPLNMVSRKIPVGKSIRWQCCCNDARCEIIIQSARFFFVFVFLLGDAEVVTASSEFQSYYSHCMGGGGGGGGIIVLHTPGNTELSHT